MFIPVSALHLHSKMFPSCKILTQKGERTVRVGCAVKFIVLNWW